MEPVFQCPSSPGFTRSFSQTPPTNLPIDGRFEVGARDGHAVYVVEAPPRPSPTYLAGAWFSGRAEELKSGVTFEGLRSGPKLTRIADGTSKTALVVAQSGLPVKYGRRYGPEDGVGEARFGGQSAGLVFGWPFAWTSPVGVYATYPVNDNNLKGIYSFHPGVFVMSHCDGSVISGDNQIDVNVLINKLARSDGK